MIFGPVPRFLRNSDSFRHLSQRHYCIVNSSLVPLPSVSYLSGYLAIWMDGISIQQAVILNLGILHKIIQAIREVRQFRRQCVELGNMAALLLVVMESDHQAGNNQSSHGYVSLAFKDTNTAIRLKATLDEVHAFVGKCIGEWNFLQRGWEIFVNRKVPRLKQELFDWITLCMMETTVRGAYPGILTARIVRLLVGIWLVRQILETNYTY
jgi:hypothetical protein